MDRIQILIGILKIWGLGVTHTHEKYTFVQIFWPISLLNSACWGLRWVHKPHGKQSPLSPQHALSHICQSLYYNIILLSVVQISVELFKPIRFSSFI